jgi:hypothetical protein
MVQKFDLKMRDESLFADDPAGFFDRSSSSAHRLDTDQLADLQIRALQRRFDELRPRIKALDVLAEAIGLREITHLEDVQPLLFPHEIYKSYSEDYLDRGRFDRLTRWLQCFTTHDLSSVEAGSFETIDSWLDALDISTRVRVTHSSGTTGKLSFFPRGLEEEEGSKDLHRLTLQSSLWDEDPQFWDCTFDFVPLAPRRGRSALARFTMLLEGMISGPGTTYRLADPDLSADVQYFMGRTRSAMLQGETVDLAASAYVLERMEDARGGFAHQEEILRKTHELLAGQLAGKRVLVFGGTPSVCTLVQEGLKQGGSDVLVRGGGHALIVGGLKGLALKPDWEDDMRRYFGASRLHENYGMTEVTASFVVCNKGRYHCHPWVVPYVFDSHTARPLPRLGEQTGRLGFFDLAARTYWGGVVSADHVTLSWNPCGCGRTSAYIRPAISRDIDGSDVGLTCAAPREAIDAVVAACG